MCCEAISNLILLITNNINRNFIIMELKTVILGLSFHTWRGKQQAVRGQLREASLLFPVNCMCMCTSMVIVTRGTKLRKQDGRNNVHGCYTHHA